MVTHDDVPITLGMRVFLRWGVPYADPGGTLQYRTCECEVVKMRSRTVRLIRVHGHRGSWKQPVEIYATQLAARYP